MGLFYFLKLVGEAKIVVEEKVLSYCILDIHKVMKI